MRQIVGDIRQLENKPSQLLKHFQIQMLRPLFYRNRTVYMVGRVINGPDRVPAAWSCWCICLQIDT
jgi:isocitrate dehydrogenase kinase/phosphatase